MGAEGECLKAAMDLYTAIGLGGLGFYVSSYGLVQLGKMDGNGAIYSVMNVVAASMAAVSLTKDFNLPSMVTQITWITVGVVGLLVRARRHVKNRPEAAPILVDMHRDGPVERMPDLALASAANQRFERVQPRAPEAARPARQVFDLRPDIAPGLSSPSSLGLQPDLAPSAP